MTVEREAFLDGYLAEVEEHLAAIARHLIAIERAPAQPQPRAMRDIYRALHTIKGLSAMIGVDAIVAISHAMEGIARAADQAGGRLPAGAVDLLSQGMRAIEQRMRSVAARKLVAAAPTTLLDALGALAERPVAAAPPLPPLHLDPVVAEKLTASEREQIVQGVAGGLWCSRVDFVPTPERAAAGLNITAVRERLARIGDLVRVLPIGRDKTADAPAGIAFALIVLHAGNDADLVEAVGGDASCVTPVAEPPSPDAAHLVAAALPPVDGDADDTVQAGKVVRVEVSRLDEALDRLSAMIVTRFRLARASAALAAAGGDTRALDEIIRESARQLRDLRGAIMRARMVSVSELLERVPLLVRGLVRATNKAVTVEIDAGRTELDKAVGERLFPAVVHLIRNAVDHAIEPEAERIARGKPAEGRLRVSCHDRASNQLELSISDDGAGIDRAAVARKAGRPVPENDDALLELIATPGLSTAATTTATSGRGLGVDIVLRTVRELGGELSMMTRAGYGTTFTMRVPLSITIIDAFSFTTRGHVFVIPVAMVEEVIEVDDARTTRGPQRAGAAVEVALIERRGAAVPLVDLAAAFGLPAGEGGVPPGLHAKALIVRRAGAPCAFRVDRMLGQHEVVVRPVSDPLVRVPGVTGSTDLGDGRPVLVVDLVALSAAIGGAPQVGNAA